MTDRELLENAAKAARIGPFSWVEPVGTKIVTNVKWNPLADDGDALRLAVKLELYVKPRVLGVRVYAWDRMLSEEPFGDDPLAATRRAIVRAAASIGKEMK